MRVGIPMDRSVEMIAAALEVLKAGGVYVPLDPDHPFERLRYIIDDAVVGAVVTHKDLHCNLSELFPGWTDITAPELSPIRILVPKRRFEPKYSGQEAARERAAYVICTSGSAGKPKGVGCCIGGLVHLLCSMAHDFAFSEKQAARNNAVHNVAGRLGGAAVAALTAKRVRQEVETLIGFFVTVAVRMDVSGSPPAAGPIGRAKVQMPAAQQNQTFRSNGSSNS